MRCAEFSNHIDFVCCILLYIFHSSLAAVSSTRRTHFSTAKIMHGIFLTQLLVLALAVVCNASLSGPYLFWGHEKVVNLQPRALMEASEQDFANLFKDAKAIVVFVRNSTSRLDGTKYPKFQAVVKNNAWTYLPQHTLAVEPFNYNANIEVINLSDATDEADNELVTGFNDAVTIYGVGEVLGILANREEEAHFLSKREAKEEIEEEQRTTTMQTPADEIEKSFIYLADGRKAILYVNAAPVLNITRGGIKESIKLVEHQKAITFDDQKAKGYGRLNIIFLVDNDKLFLRFNFSRRMKYWAMKAVEVEYKDYKNVIPVVGNIYDAPSAPVGFSYRCSAYQMLFKNGSDTLVLSDYQVQPWLNGSHKFGEPYNCIGFTTAPIWAGVLITLFLCGILSIGILALMDIKTPNRFESSRSKPLSFFVQE